MVCLRLKLSVEINLSAIPANTLATSTDRYWYCIEKNIKKVNSDFAVDNLPYFIIYTRPTRTRNQKSIRARLGAKPDPG